MDGPGALGGLRAGACDLPYMLIPDLGTDLPRVNPGDYRPVAPEPGQRPLLSVPAIQPDIALLHGQQADELGNVQLFGGCFFDSMFAQAAKKVVVSVDRIVDTQVIRENNRLTKIPAALVDAVVLAPKGAHPTSSAASYGVDEGHIKAYLQASRTPEAFQTYLDRYVLDSESRYLKEVGDSDFAAGAQPQMH